jgi:hypothetical protein
MFMGAMATMIGLAGWLKVKFSLVIMYELSALMFFAGMLLMVTLFRDNKEVSPLPE